LICTHNFLFAVGEPLLLGYNRPARRVFYCERKIKITMFKD
jgi:hypothetical protein